jgi:Ca-activated chloride channel family protein
MPITVARPAPAEQPSLLGEIVAEIAESPLPLEHTDVVAHVFGALASVAVTQRFRNHLTAPAELVYRFPLPHEGVVGGFELTIGTRTVVGVVEEIVQARATYEQAVAAGRRAGLATQERSNLYTVRLGNVMPGETILATFRFHRLVPVANDQFELVLPFGVTPRYVSPDSPTAALEAGETYVPIAPAGSQIGTLGVRISVDAGLPVDAPISPSHQLLVERIDDRRFDVRLPDATIPNKDLVVRYAVREPDQLAAVHGAAWRTAPQDDRGGFVMAALVPPPMAGAAPPAPPPREFVFVLDRSGSMQGPPIAQARNALSSALHTLEPNDTFALIAFDTSVESFEPRALPKTDAHVADAERWLAGIDARNGTNILPAIDTALRLPPDPERQRVVVFFTDGSVAGEQQVIARLRRGLGSGRLFAFGIGPSVNRALVTAMAREGRGTAEFLTANEEIEEALIRFQDRLSFPVMTDITLDWEGATIADAHPSRLPDLYHGETLTAVARCADPNGPIAVTLRGKRGDEAVMLRVVLPPPVAEPAIGRLWAKEHVDELLDRHVGEELPDAVRANVVRVACAHGIMTRYTAFVAVDSGVANAGGKTEMVRVSSPLPEGLSHEGFGLAGRFPAMLNADTSSRSPKGFAGRTSANRRQRWSDAVQDLAAGLARALPTEALDQMLKSVPVPPSAPIPPASPTPGAPPKVVEELRARTTLRELARAQRASGAWGDGRDDVAWTSAAVVAFARHGETTVRGQYRQIVRRAVAWLDGLPLAGADAWLRAWARAELAHAEGRPASVAPLGERSDGDLGAAIEDRLFALGAVARTGARLPHAWSDPRAFAVVGRAGGPPPTELPWRALAAARV